MSVIGLLVLAVVVVGTVAGWALTRNKERAPRKLPHDMTTYGKISDDVARHQGLTGPGGPGL
jgi:hypothetical protein